MNEVAVLSLAAKIPFPVVAMALAILRNSSSSSLV